MAIKRDKVRAQAQKYLQKGQLDKAIREFQKLVDDDPKDVRTLLKIGDLETRKGAHAEATITYSKVAAFYSEQGFFLKAVAVYKQILKIDPSLLDINVRLAELYHQLGLLSDATNQYRQVAQIYEQEEKFPEAIDVLSKMVELDPDNVAGQIKLAEVQAQSGDVSGAEASFKAAAEYLKSKQRIEDYIKLAERMLHLNDNNTRMARELAEIYLGQGDAKRALAKLQICFNAEPKNLEVLELLARAFESLGQHQKTLSVLKEVSRIHRDKGDDAALTETMRRILAIAPDDAEAKAALSGSQGARQALARIVPIKKGGSGGVQEVDRRPDTATPHHLNTTAPASTSLDVSSDDIVVESPVENLPSVLSEEESSEEIRQLIVETDIYIKYGLRDKAMEHLERIFEQSPGHREAQLKKRELLLKSGEPDEALSVLMEIAVQDERRGRLDLAVSALDEVLSLSDGHTEAQEMKTRLSQMVANAPSSEPTVSEVEVEIDLSDDPLATDFDDVAFAHEDEDIVLDDGLVGGAGIVFDEEERDEPPAGVEDDDVLIEVELEGDEDLGVETEGFDDEISLDDESIDPVVVSAGADFDVEIDFEGDESSSLSAVPTDEILEDDVVVEADFGAEEMVEDEVLEASVHAETPESTPVIAEPGVVATGGLNDLDDLLAAAVPKRSERKIDVSEMADGVPNSPLADSAEDLIDVHDGPDTSSSFEVDDVTDTPAPKDIDALVAVTSAAVDDESAEALFGDLSLDVGTSLEEGIEEIRFFLEQGLTDEATDALEALLAQEPEHPELLAIKVQLDSRSDDGALSDGDALSLEDALADDFAEINDDEDFQVSFDDVFEEFKKGVAEQVDEGDAETHYHLGIAYKEMGLLNDSIREFELATRAEEHEIAALTMIGIVHLENGKQNEALEAFKRGLTSKKVTRTSALALRYEIGVAYSALNLPAVAAKFFEKVHSMDSSFRDIRTRLSETKAQLASPTSGDDALDSLLEETEQEREAASRKVSFV